MPLTLRRLSWRNPAAKAGVRTAGLGSVASIPGLALWLDAGQIAAADLSALSMWADLSGRGKDFTQGTVANQPKLRTTNVNLLSYNQATGGELNVVAGSFAVNGAGAPTVSIMSGSAIAGARSARTTFSAAPQAFDGISLQGTPVTVGQAYAAIGTVRNNDSVARTFHLELSFRDSGGAGLGGQLGNGLVVAAGATVDLPVVTSVALASSATVTLKVVCASPGANQTFDIDNLAVVRGTTAAFSLPVSLPNGRPVVQFDGINDVMRNTTGIETTYGDLTILLVARSELVGPCTFFENEQSRRITCSGATGYRPSAQSAGGVFLNTSPTLTFGAGYHVFSATFSAVSPMSVAAQFDSSATATVSFTAGDTPYKTNNAWNLGAGDNGFTDIGHCSIAEIAVWPRVLSTADELPAALAMLKAKYGTP